jgi:signal transduction histidine kinase
MPSGRGAVPVAAAVLVSAAIFSFRPLGLAATIENSLAGTVLLCVPFLIAYALGYQNGVAVGLLGVALMIGALELANGSFSPIGGMITIGPWAGGRIVRSRRHLSDQLKERNNQLLAQQQAYAAEAVRYERSRIAADLHDVVGHALSLMVVQASAGQRVALARGAGAGAGDSADIGDSTRSALETVAEAARQAQADVGLLAGMLSPGQPVEPSSLAPGGPGGLVLAAELVQQVQAAGVEVAYRLVSDGEGGDVDAMSAEVVSRIVTEALTNAVKHAPGAPVTVDIQAVDGRLAVTVENGPPVHAGSDLARAGGGYGLAGMRDRVLVLGGQFDAAPTGDSGWRVHAVWPRPFPLS